MRRSTNNERESGDCFLAPSRKVQAEGAHAPWTSEELRKGEPVLIEDSWTGVLKCAYTLMSRAQSFDVEHFGAAFSTAVRPLTVQLVSGFALIA